MPISHHLSLHISAIRLHTSSFLQLFIHQTYGHTFPISQETSEPKVHEVCRYSRIFRMIKPSHFCLSSCSVCCHVMATSHRSLRFSAGSYPLLILIFPPILFRHFQKFSKLLHPLRLHRSSIHLLPIMLKPRIIIAPLFRIILRRIPLIGLYKLYHLIVFRLPLLLLSHVSINLKPPSSFQSIFRTHGHNISLAPL